MSSPGSIQLWLDVKRGTRPRTPGGARASRERANPLLRRRRLGDAQRGASAYSSHDMCMHMHMHIHMHMHMHIHMNIRVCLFIHIVYVCPTGSNRCYCLRPDAAPPPEPEWPGRVSFVQGLSNLVRVRSGLGFGLRVRTQATCLFRP